MEDAKLYSLCFQFPLALLFYFPGSDGEEVLDFPHDTGFTHSKPFLLLPLIFPTMLLNF